MDSQQLFSLIQTIISLAPAIVLIWKMSGYAHDIKENRKDIDGLGAKMNSSIEKQQAERYDMINKITVTGNNIIEVLTTIKFMKSDIENIKNELKERNLTK